MARGKPLSDDLRAIVLNMARYLDVPMIASYTSIGKRTIYRILEDYHKRGLVSTRAHLLHTLRGKRRSLTAADVRVRLIFHCHLK